jgi:tyrosyl-tRNA synthetase
VGDADVLKCLRMLTFLPMEEVERLSSLKDEEINRAKEILAFEVTKLVHGEEEAEKAQNMARAAFGGGSAADMPSKKLDPAAVGEGIGIVALMKLAGLVPSNSEGFRTIEQGGLTIDGEKVSDTKMVVTKEMLSGDGIVLKKGKKTFLRLSL